MQDARSVEGQRHRLHLFLLASSLSSRPPPSPAYESDRAGPEFSTHPLSGAEHALLF